MSLDYETNMAPLSYLSGFTVEEERKEELIGYQTVAITRDSINKTFQC